MKHQLSIPGLWQRTLAVLALVLAAALSPAALEFASASPSGDSASNQYALVAELNERATREQPRNHDLASSGKQAKLYALGGGEIAAWAPEKALLAAPVAVRAVPATHASRSGLTRAPPLA